MSVLTKEMEAPPTMQKSMRRTASVAVLHKQKLGSIKNYSPQKSTYDELAALTQYGSKFVSKAALYPSNIVIDYKTNLTNGLVNQNFLTEAALEDLDRRKDHMRHSPEVIRRQEEHLSHSNIGIASALNELNKMIETGDSHRIIKADGAEKTIETLPGVPVYCRVDITPPGPYIINCKYAHRGEFLIATSVSHKQKFPDKKRSQQIKNRPELLEVDLQKNPGT